MYNEVKPKRLDEVTEAVDVERKEKRSRVSALAL